MCKIGNLVRHLSRDWLKPRQPIQPALLSSRRPPIIPGSRAGRAAGSDKPIVIYTIFIVSIFLTNINILPQQKKNHLYYGISS
jgi:hypothetical protein